MNASKITYYPGAADIPTAEVPVTPHDVLFIHKGFILLYAGSEILEANVGLHGYKVFVLAAVGED